MSITQTVEVPDSHRLTIDVPSEIPAGPVILTFRSATPQKDVTPVTDRLAGIDEVRQLLQKEMTQNGTTVISAVSGDGWEAYVRERYAES
jgi:hypothetical protein